MPKSDAHPGEVPGRKRTTSAIAAIFNGLANTPQHISSIFGRRYPTIAVTGMSGVGKTRLVDSWTKRNTAADSLEVGSTTMERRTRQSA